MAGHWLLGVLMTSVVTHVTATGCSPYRPINTAGCTATQQQSTEYRMLNSVLRDGESSDTPAMDFLWNATLEMHLFLHPNCAKPAESALYLFYDMYPPNPVDQVWQSQMQQVLRQASPYTHRRRRRSTHNYSNEESVIVDLLTNMVQATSPSCVQLLINNHKDRAATSFRSRVAGFRVPPGSYPISSSSSPTKHTTPAPPTTKPTPTTTPKVHDYHNSYHHHHHHYYYYQAHCHYHACQTFECEGIQCLLMDNTVQPCPLPNQLCFIDVHDSPSRHISRGCKDKYECQRIHNDNCHNVETDTKGHELHCRFCCDVDGCNRPPHLIPQAGNVYPSS